MFTIPAEAFIVVRKSRSIKALLKDLIRIFRRTID